MDEKAIIGIVGALLGAVTTYPIAWVNDCNQERTLSKNNWIGHGRQPIR